MVGSVCIRVTSLVLCNTSKRLWSFHEPIKIISSLPLSAPDLWCGSYVTSWSLSYTFRKDKARAILFVRIHVIDISPYTTWSNMAASMLFVSYKRLFTWLLVLSIFFGATFSAQGKQLMIWKWCRLYKVDPDTQNKPYFNWHWVKWVPQIFFRKV